MPGMRVALVCSAMALTGCITIHTIDLGAHRASLGSSCNVPMNKGGQVPSGWAEIGRVQIENASSWSEAQFADEFRNQACDMGAEYVVVTGDGDYVEARFLMQQQAQATSQQPPSPGDQEGYRPYVPEQSN